MAKSFVLQDWTALQGKGSDTIVQTEDSWLDFADYTDVIFYITFKAFSGTSVRLHLQTSPSKDNDMFAGMTGGTLTVSVANRLVVAVRSGAAEPLARYVRWTADAGGAEAWTLMFRVLGVAIKTG